MTDPVTRGAPDRLFELLEPVAESQGVDLVEVGLSRTGRGHVVRIVIHSEAGVTHADCARVTRAAGAALEEDETFPGSYVLEVGSPGLDRVLKEAREFDVFRGRRVRVWIREGGTSERSGVVAGRRGDETVAILEDDGEERVFDWASVAKARLVPEQNRRDDGGEA
ncbi:MAG: ribosome maturation factor RimP [bacterium]